MTSKILLLVCTYILSLYYNLNILFRLVQNIVARISRKIIDQNKLQNSGHLFSHTRICRQCVQATNRWNDQDSEYTFLDQYFLIILKQKIFDGTTLSQSNTLVPDECTHFFYTVTHLSRCLILVSARSNCDSISTRRAAEGGHTTGPWCRARTRFNTLTIVLLCWPHRHVAVSRSISPWQTHPFK